MTDRTWVIKEALRGYISNEMHVLEAVEEGIRAADAGDVVAHDLVMAELEVIRRHASRER